VCFIVISIREIKERGFSYSEKVPCPFAVPREVTEKEACTRERIQKRGGEREREREREREGRAGLCLIETRKPLVHIWLHPLRSTFRVFSPFFSSLLSIGCILAPPVASAWPQLAHCPLIHFYYVDVACRLSRDLLCDIYALRNML